jgi:magnesium chelatase family protein
VSLASIRSFAFSGIEAVPVEVQVQISSGLPAFLVVGLPDKAVGEARERVRAALTAMGLSLPPKRVLINLAPADLLKEGSHFDLPMALAVLAAMDVLPRDDLCHYAAIGELSLDGTLNPVAGVLPAAIGAGMLELGLICPGCQGGEAAWAGSVEVLAPPDLLSLINHFRGSQILASPDTAGLAAAVPSPDLSEVKGMETARRALEIAAAGGHNLLLVGPPGAGKSMLAARLPGLLPDLLPTEALEVSMIHSVAGLLDGGRLLKRPPFREPHHGASQAALAGGGCEFQRFPGLNTGLLDSGRSNLASDAALAHRGVLLVSQAGSLSRAVLDELSVVLHSGRAIPAWSKGGESIPAHPIIVLTVDAMETACPPDAIPNHLVGCFDMVAAVNSAGPDALGVPVTAESSAAVAARVDRARQFARRRKSISMLAVDQRPACQRLLSDARERFGIDDAGMAAASRVARTIADLAGSLGVEPSHAAEALSFRHRRARVPAPA